MVALATTVGVGIMVDSFRGGVAIWIKRPAERRLVYRPTPRPKTAASGSRCWIPAALAAVRTTSVAARSTYRRIKIDLDGRPIALIAVDLAPQSQTGYRLLDGNPAIAWREFQTGEAVLISEPLVGRRQIRTGDRLELLTPSGLKPSPLPEFFSTTIGTC